MPAYPHYEPVTLLSSLVIFILLMGILNYGACRLWMGEFVVTSLFPVLLETCDSRQRNMSLSLLSLISLCATIQKEKYSFAYLHEFY